MSDTKIGVFSDLEGPLDKRDGCAMWFYQLCQMMGFGDIGYIIYAIFSDIDDIWGFGKKSKVLSLVPDYSSGYTLSWMLAFYKAIMVLKDLKYASLEEFYKSTIKIVPNSREAVQALDQQFIFRIISTSYDSMVRSFCAYASLDFSKTVCTQVPRFDDIPISQQEAIRIVNFLEQVGRYKEIKYDSTTYEVHPDFQELYDMVTRFMWEDMYNWEVGWFMKNIKPVGEQQKREALVQLMQMYNLPKSQVMYDGDSQTDRGCAEELQGEGLVLSFNGKGPINNLADILYIGTDARVIHTVASVFSTFGREGVREAFRTPIKLEKVTIGDPGKEVEMEQIIGTNTPETFQMLNEHSVMFRKNFRGEAGQLP